MTATLILIEGETQTKATLDKGRNLLASEMNCMKTDLSSLFAKPSWKSHWE
jgi:hypothetical protein